ncbi:MAG TPA: inositol monophosphatase family protein [Candidatus Limnocylindrales bacterium]|nr:inositol monophosphatase family protein [Candidatus Limnocylindrales bacterium]
MKTVPPKPALAAAVKAARAAGRLMYANWHRPKRVKVAEAHDIKLELDVRCQQLIGKILRTAFPQIPLLGEEGDSGDVNAEYRWVVDPIDGTVNYFFGLPHAAVSIALQKRDECRVTSVGNNIRSRTPSHVPRHTSHVTVLGVIYGPFTDELWTAVRGGPARLNGKIIRVSQRSRLEEAVIAMGFSKSRENLEKSLPHVNRLARRVKKIRIMGSAALELAYVASGRLDAYIERTINLWDVAAGALLIECAGGEFYARPAPGGKLRMCADNGRLRRKLQIDGLLK